MNESTRRKNIALISLSCLGVSLLALATYVAFRSSQASKARTQVEDIREELDYVALDFYSTADAYRRGKSKVPDTRMHELATTTKASLARIGSNIEKLKATPYFSNVRETSAAAVKLARKLYALEKQCAEALKFAETVSMAATLRMKQP